MPLLRSLRWRAPLAMALTCLGCSAEANSNDDDGSSGSGNQPLFMPADGVYITAMGINQGVYRQVQENGQLATSPIPLVAGRGGLFRVFYSVDEMYNGNPVTAQLTIGDAAPIEVITPPLSGTSTLENYDSTINFNVPPEVLTEGVGYRVDLLHPTASTTGQNGWAKYPAEGQEALPTVAVGPMRIVLVPVQYNADGSGRLPDISEAQIQGYKDSFHAHYPSSTIEIAVTAPYAWNQGLAANGQGFGQLLEGIRQLRNSSGAAPDEYYYGIVAPGSNFSTFCGFGCVAGLSNLVENPSDAQFRAGIGLGFSGDGSISTAVHELGHVLGRAHAPCQVFDAPDPGFPYSDGSIGHYGYDIVTGVLHPPSDKDFMGYCDPQFVSDYTYQAIFQRFQAVNVLAKWHAPAGFVVPSYTELHLDGEGHATRMSTVTPQRPLAGNVVSMELTVDGAARQVKGHFYPYSHVGGGVLMVAEAAAPTLRDGAVQAQLRFTHGGVSIAARLDPTPDATRAHK